MIMATSKKRIAARNRDVQDRAVEEGLVGLVIGGAKAFDDMDDATEKRLSDELYAYVCRAANAYNDRNDHDMERRGEAAMRKCNKPAAFALARQLNGDGDHEAPLDDATLEDHWARFRIGQLPEPLDAICLQMFVALPAMTAVRLMQVCAYHAPVNGILDASTMAAVERMRSAGIEELILLAQAGYVIGRADHEMCGLDLGAGLGRVAMCTRFLEDWAMANRISVPLHAV
jgi:hypothetical protein